MSHRPSTRLRALASGALALAVGAGGLAAQPAVPAAADAARSPVVATPGDPVPGLSDVDVRGAVPPTALQRHAARALKAEVRWNAYGTPASVYAADGSLGRAAAADPVAAARAWLRAHTALLGLTRAQVDEIGRAHV